MSYADHLSARGYTRITVERTQKQPGDLVLRRLDQPVERVPDSDRVVAIRGRRGRG